MKKVVSILAIAIFILFAFMWSYPKIKEWHHGQKFKALPWQVYSALCRFDEFRFSSCSQLNQCPIEIRAWRTMYPDIPGEYNLTFATPYYFKFRDGEGYIVIFHKNTPDHEQADVFWLDNDGKCSIILSSANISPEHRQYWNDEIKLPDFVYTELRYFELEKHSTCSKVDAFPEEILDWHSDIYTIIDREIDRKSATPYYFQNESNEYLLIWDDIDPLYLWVDSNEVRNRIAEYMAKQLN